ncbi:hypothetical protein [Chryseobacterium sp. R2A-55]|uniref:hypothetical protein n=1 Tax=Chryseobacterium sp. R2A-55 TaxID=2744445 RepID=UPI001F3B923A|nr:hypothetical protein [Chryseobacterium sp. R2A-55]
MKHFLFFISIFYSLVSVSCISRKPAEPVVITNTKEVTKIVKDTIFKVEADSSFYKAYIECKDGKPVIIKDSIIVKAGKNVIVPQVVLKDHFIQVDCKQEALELYKTWRETYVKEHEQKPVYVPQIEYKDKPLTFWQKTQLWFGRIFIGLLAIFIITGFLRWKGIV